MLLKSLVVHNFGPYRGRQKIEFAKPPGEGPITLIGGMNGFGKTTLLDALQLALYGKLAQCSNRNGLSYAEFLRRSIHRAEHPIEGAAVELSFDVDGREYRVNRWWAPVNGDVNEQCEVFIDDWPDPEVSERWLEVAEDILPNRLAPLLFFDGERIEQLANPDAAPAILEQAVQSLLGLEIVEKLVSDLKVLETRQLKGVNERGEDVDEVTDLAALLHQLESRRSEVSQQIAHAEDVGRRLLEKQHQLDQKFEREGGHLWLDVQRTEAAADHEREEISRIEDELRRLAEGVLPLALVSDKLVDLQRRLAHSEDLKRRIAAAELVEQRDASLLEHLRQMKVAADVHSQVAAWLEGSRRELRVQDEGEIVDAPEGLSARLETLVSYELGAVREEALRLCGELERRREQLARLEERRASTPDEATVKELHVNRMKVSNEIELNSQRVTELRETLERTSREDDAARRKASRAIEAAASKIHARRESARLVKHIARARRTLATFREASLKSNLERLGDEITGAFLRLSRKGNLFSEITIDPETFEIQLQRHDRHPHATDRLSAGERQLVAVAIVWGLTRCTRKQLPLVIDTPLGRLDSEHRTRLVDHYFPHAAPQVVLLSTDEEIDAALYARMRGSIGRAYSLEFEMARQCSVINTGYSWGVTSEATG